MLKFFVFLVLIIAIVHGFPRRPKKIIGGSDVVPGTTPWLAAILYTDYHVANGFILTGWNIITTKHGLAPHLPSFYTVLLNTTKLSEPGMVFRVDHILIHQTSDLAMFFLKNELEITSDVHPIKPVTQASEEYEGQEVEAYGWGRTEIDGQHSDHVQSIQMTTLTRQECKKEWEGKPFEDHEICARPKNGGSLCFGDDGALLRLTDYNRAHGIYSWGLGCLYGKPEVFVDLGYHTDWIQENMKW